ncbi:6489_t:CDS:1, partial [Scutellospora calospora]
ESSHDSIVQQSANSVVKEPPNSSTSFGPLGDKDFEFSKLQEELTLIAADWKEKDSQDIRSLRVTLRQAIQTEKTRLARVNVVVSSNILDAYKIAPNAGIRKQNRY